MKSRNLLRIIESTFVRNCMWSHSMRYGLRPVTQVARDLGSKCILSSVWQWCLAEPPLCGWSWKSSTNSKKSYKKKSSSREMLSLPRQVARARPSAITLFHTQGPACTQVRHCRDNKCNLAHIFTFPGQPLIYRLCDEKRKDHNFRVKWLTQWW